MTFVIILVWAALMLTLFLALIRNQQVFVFRQAMLEIISQRSGAAIQDLQHDPELSVDKINATGDFMSYRYATYETVPYNEMVLKFWKPLKPEAWYDDISFLR